MKLHRINAILLKYWYFSTGDLSRVFDALYWPIMGVIVFGFTTLYLQKVAQSPLIVFLLGGLIIWIIFERIQQDVAIFLLEDFWSNNVANMLSTPLLLSELFAALIITGFIRVIVTFAAMALIALIAYHFSIIGMSWTSMAFVIPLLLFGWALGIFVSGVIFRYGPRIQIFAWGVAYLIQPIGAVFYPVAALPGWLQPVAYATPVAYTFEGFRLAHAGTFSLQILLTGIGLALVYLVLGYWYFVNSVNKSRQNGKLVQY